MGRVKGGSRCVATLEEVDSFSVLLCFGVHGADDCELVGDGGTLWKELGEVGAGDVCRDIFKRAAGGGAGFGVPSFKLAGSATKPKEDTMFLFFLGDLCESRRSKEAGKTHGRDRSGGEALQKLAAVEVMIRRTAVLRWIGLGHQLVKRNSALVTRAQTNCWIEDLFFGLTKESERSSSLGSGSRESTDWKISRMRDCGFSIF